MRLQKLTEENDLKIAKDMFGADAIGGIDAMNPQSKEEFDDFSKAVLDKITSLESSEHFQDFAEDFVKNLCMSLNVQTLKKCKTHVEAFTSAKLKEEKAATAKGKKGKSLKSLKMDRDSTTNYYDGYDDMDDFMWRKETRDVINNVFYPAQTQPSVTKLLQTQTTTLHGLDIFIFCLRN